ncbi:hypothetical protein WJX72_002556 [[Myrmecia] bisecta]|uniref:Uncharacterized protein n=1 Tax=[Myrmecia] bisecta TaxID=41462 RepID=A0AAW1Q6P1_9CHLO
MASQKGYASYGLGQAGAAIRSGFNAIQAKKTQGGQPLSVEELQAEHERLSSALHSIDEQLLSVRTELQQPRREEEQDIWETKLVILQDTRRMLQDELDLIEVEVMGRQRMARLAEERALAEATGWAQLKRLQDSLAQLEARLDRLKQELYFPAVKGYKFAFGSNGKYVGGKDMFVSEISGNYLVSAAAEATSTGEREASFTVQLGSSASQPSVQRSDASHRSSASSGSKAGSGPGSAPGLQPLGFDGEPQRSKGKRMAMKFLNKLGTKEKFTKKAIEGEAEPYAPKPYWPAAGSHEGPSGKGKAKTLASRLLSRKGTAPTSKLSFGSNMLGSGKHRRSFTHPPGGSSSQSLASLGLSDSPMAEAGDFAAQVAAPVFQDVLEAAAEAADVDTPKSGITVDLEDPELLPPASQDPAASTPTILEDQALAAEAQSEPRWTSDDLPQAAADQAGESGEQFENGGVSARPSESVEDTSLSQASPSGRPTGSEQWEGVPSTAGAARRSGPGGQDSSSLSGRQGMFVVLRCEAMGLVGEKGTQLPNVSIGELSLELEFQLTLTFTYTSVKGWQVPAKPTFEIAHLGRVVKGNSVPLPKTLLRAIVSALVPRILQRRILNLLPQELGQYLLDSGKGIQVGGEIALVGPALSAMDAELASNNSSQPVKPKDAVKAAQQHAAAQEARNMLGISHEQAVVLAELFSGRYSLLATPSPCTIVELLSFHAQHAGNARVWEHLGVVWDTALRTLSNYHGIKQPMKFTELMDQGVAALTRKPVRARFLLTTADVAVNVDAGLTALRDYFERSAREMHAKLAQSGDPSSAPGSPDQPLEVQLDALEAWHAWCLARLRIFKNKFRGAAGTLVAGADARNFSVGLEGARYEGPLRLHLPIPMRAMESDGAFSFEIPLPNPERQVVLRRFLDGLRSALHTPMSMLRSPQKPAVKPHIRANASRLSDASSVGSEQANGSESEVASTSGRDPITALDWFGKVVGNQKQPLRLGKVIVNGMRVRVRLDERRIADLLQGLDTNTLGSSFASTASSVLGCLGDVAHLSFAPASSDAGVQQYLLALESSEVSNLSAELASLGFRSGEGVSPGRALRVLHGLIRAGMLTFSSPKAQIEAVDSKFDALYQHIVRDALDVAMCMEARSGVVDNELFVYVGGIGVDGPELCPLSLTNDLDLVSVAQSIRGEPEQAG